MIARQAFRSIQPLKRVTIPVREHSSPSEITLFPARLTLPLYRPCLGAESSQRFQGIRHYAAQGASGGSSNSTLYGGIAAATALLGGGYYYFRQADTPVQLGQSVGKSNPTSGRSGSSPSLASDSKPLNSTFTGGEQGWISLKLESVEKLSHNTNRFRFALPNPDDVSGLQIACSYLIDAAIKGRVTN